jgi:hypothetical protein
VTTLAHLRVLGSTQYGKTYWCNELHQRWPSHDWHKGRRVPRISIFVDTKGTDPLWGARIRSLEPVQRALLHGAKLVYDPPRRADGIAWEEADRHLLHLWGEVQNRARRVQWSSSREPWLQLVVDEADKWEGTYIGADGKLHRHPNTLEDMAARGLGLGLRLVYVTQHPAGINPRTRNNLTEAVVFGLGDEGRRCLQAWGWPARRIAEHTSRRRYFATLTGDGWSFHEPRPRRWDTGMGEAVGAEA